MKTCSSCHQTKPDNEFYTKGSSGHLNSLCKICFNDYCQTRWIERKKKAIEYLGGKCARCGYSDHYAAMQFHHTGNKDYTWNKLRLMNWERAKEELDKCILLCANCHAILHSLEP
jgi:hypothetical protein